MSAPVYRAAYEAYFRAGWRGVLPLPPRAKKEPPKGYTGRDGIDPSFADLSAWAEQHPHANLALRLPDGVIGIDVDAYDAKTGAAALAEAESRWGALAPAWCSTSRDDGVSGIRLYRVPKGIELADRITFPQMGLGDIEIIQRHHRYVIGWPSIHASTGELYQWRGPDGAVSDQPPAVEHLPELNTTWIEALRVENQHNGAEVPSDGAYDVRTALTEGEPARRVAWKLGEAIIACNGASRHDHTRDNVLALLRYGKQGDSGVSAALQALSKAFVAAVGPDRAGGADEAVAEFRKFVFGEQVGRLLAEPSYDDWTANVGEPPPDEPPGGGSRNGAPALADRLLTRSALRDLPDPQPLIRDVVDQSTVALLYGKWGTGKSFIALDWAASVATGRPWQGRVAEQRRALYVAAEGAHGLKARVDAWETGWHVDIGDDALSVLPRPINLTKFVETSNLKAVIAWGGYGFIVIDTLARCMVGADENSARDCGEVVDVLHQLRESTPDGRGVVVGVHHSGKDGRTFRGSSVFEAGADTVYSISLDGSVIVLDREKRKDGPIADLHRLKLAPIAGTKSLVVESHGGETHDDRAGLLLSHFESHFAATGAYSSQLRDVVGVPKATFYRALSDLLKRGDIVNAGTDRRPFYKLATK